MRNDDSTRAATKYDQLSLSLLEVIWSRLCQKRQNFADLLMSFFCPRGQSNQVPSARTKAAKAPLAL
jgi:hypothetical protein